ncbi:MAG: PLP-dependent aminotransferase family protein [Ruminococcus sp.]|nr:PLP-dependent aminotransferase family protein [Ruminococcus sp.]
MNDLTISLDGASKIPLYEQIYSYIKQEIQTGRIRSGDRLPSTRALCRYLEVSRSTVELAYEQLMSEGYVEAKACRGYFAADVEGLYQLEGPVPAGRDAEIPQTPSWPYDFTPNGVDLNSFPYNAWRKLSRESLVDDRAELFRLGSPQGEYGLRSAICSYLHQARGVNCTPEQIIVGAGNDYLLMLLATVIGQDHKVAFENPTYRQAYRLFQNLSFQICTVDMDEKGMDAAKLEASGADIAFVMPSHQYPLGIVMPIRRRMELLRWAGKKEGRYIIEDDYDSEFRYKGKPVPALQGCDSREKVIYIGTFSKAIAPAIRMSYLVLPRPLLKRYQERSGFLNSTVSKVDQLILKKFIEDGYFERHLNKTRALYKSRHDTLLSCLKSGLCRAGGDSRQGKKTEDARGNTGPRFRISGEHAGVHLLLHVLNGMTEQELIDRAKKRGVRVYGLSEYDVEPRPEAPAAILLGYANMSEEKIMEAVKILEEEWMS